MNSGTVIPSSGVGSLSTLLKRLEAATSRLEDIALAQQPPSTTAPHHHAAHSTTAASAPSAPAVLEVAVPPSVKAFEELIDGALAKYLALSKELRGLVAAQAAQVAAAFAAQKDFIALAAACTKLSSSAPAYATLLGPTQSALVAVVDIKEKNRAAKEIYQLSTVSEGIPALGWVTLDSKPAPYVGDMKDSAQFYANRVIKDSKDSKETDPKQVEWARSFIVLLEDLRKYVFAHHTTGLVWNSKGVDPTTYSASSIPSSSGPPPPPPPPPPTPSTPAPAAPAAAAALKPAAGDMGGVFAALNKGEGVTAGLKKVEKSEMTHKNPGLRAGGLVPTGPVGKGPQKPPKPHSFQKKPPKTELDGNKWNIENHENNLNIRIDPTEINQIINIFNVKSSVIQINGKVNAVSLVNCHKVCLLLDSTVSSLAISSSPSFTVQILGHVPTILIDGTDGGQIYLSKESLGVEIVTAKSSSVNVSLPVEGEEEGVFVEKAVPEQFKTVIREGKLVTSVVEHSG